MAIIAVALIATILPAAAEMSAKQMIESFTKEDTTTIKVYFRGLHEAFAWSNTAVTGSYAYTASLPQSL